MQHKNINWKKNNNKNTNKKKFILRRVKEGTFRLREMNRDRSPAAVLLTKKT